ncbi:MAG: hypothetical protein QOC63_2874 [Mycobacterium sp.]|jgi:hypothetical protein|nr:hypothetical protein [Mycobacterium sp.]
MLAATVLGTDSTATSWLQHLEPRALGLARDGVHGRLGRRVRGAADDDPMIRALAAV